MFLTRMGKSAKFMVTEIRQVDLPRRTISGLKEALLVLKDIEGIGIVYLDDKDIVRHRLVKVLDAPTNQKQTFFKLVYSIFYCCSNVINHFLIWDKIKLKKKTF
jgi:hypothetical protein